MILLRILTRPLKRAMEKGRKGEKEKRGKSPLLLGPFAPLFSYAPPDLRTIPRLARRSIARALRK